MKVKAIEKRDGKIRIIDQTKLPSELVYHELDDYHDVITAIKRLEIRGAPAIGIAAAYGLAMAVEQKENADIETIKNLADEIKAARPTAVNLFWAVDRLVRVASSVATHRFEEMLGILWREAEKIHNEDRQMCQKIGEYGSGLIRNGDSILTHCNTGALATGGIGTALGVIYTCRDLGKMVKVYADETRPLLQGARLTAWELKEEGIDVTLICDNMAAMLMQQHMINHIIVGADRIARNGDTANKIGTYGLAVLAEYHNVPFYVAAPASTFDPETESGDKINIEKRGAEEITGLFGKPIAPIGTKVFSPAFDVTPNELITCFITDKGIKPGGRK